MYLKGFGHSQSLEFMALGHVFCLWRSSLFDESRLPFADSLTHSSINGVGPGRNAEMVYGVVCFIGCSLGLFSGPELVLWRKLLKQSRARALNNDRGLVS